MTRLPMACYEGRVDEVRRLLDGGADIHQQDTVGRSPLFVACQYGRDAVVRLLLDHERSTSRSAPGRHCAGTLLDQARDDGASPLWIACRHGHAAIARLLLERGADTDAERHDRDRGVTDKDTPGETPLRVACFYDHADVVRALLRHGADLRGGSPGYSALSLAEQDRERAWWSRHLPRAHRRSPSCASELVLRAACAERNRTRLFIAAKLVIWTHRTKERMYSPGGVGALSAQASFERNVRQRVC